jgi:hypothetical protein
MKKDFKTILSQGMVLVLLVGLMFACGGEKIVKFEKLGITVKLSSGWEADKEEDASKYLPVRVELRYKGKRTLIISRYKILVDNFEAMEKAFLSTKGIKMISQEKLDSGIGFTYEKRGKKLYLYYITLGDTTYECKPNDFYYDEKDNAAAIEIIKTIKKA